MEKIPKRANIAFVTKLNGIVDDFFVIKIFTWKRLLKMFKKKDVQLDHQPTSIGFTYQASSDLILKSWHYSYFLFLSNEKLCTGHINQIVTSKLLPLLVIVSLALLQSYHQGYIDCLAMMPTIQFEPYGACFRLKG